MKRQKLPTIIIKICLICAAVISILAAFLFFHPNNANKNLRIDQNDELMPVKFSKTGNNGGTGGLKKLEENNVFYKVVKVIDGDTITVDTGSKRETVRLMGINAPEVGMKEECFGKEASERAKQILSGVYVGLEKDQTQDDRDKYGRFGPSPIYCAHSLNVIS